MSVINGLEECIRATSAGGCALMNLTPENVETKGDAYVGHHAIVSDADFASQKAILHVLQDYDALFMTEEHVKDETLRRRIVRNVSGVNRKKMYIIDELDGSSSFAAGHYEWSISVGYAEGLVHKAGAVYAPKIGGGLLFYASKGEGAWLEDRRNESQMQVSDRKLKDSYILLGPDNFLTKYPQHNRLVNRLGDAARTVNSNGSSALALALVAAGKADAVVQPLQCPWDWAAGKLLVEEAGGKMIFYERVLGGLYMNRVNKLKPKHYDPTKRAVGFIAAHESLAEQIMEMLLRE